MSRLIGRAQPMPGLFSGRVCGLLAAFCLLLAALTDQTEKSGICADWSGRLIGSIGLIAVLALAVISARRRPVDGDVRTENILLCLMIAGFLLRLWYVLYTPVNVRQHDVFSFGETEPMTAFNNYRHAEYIEYICRYLSLPEVDPRAVGLSQLYHPPLHHLIAGLWLRLQLALGCGYRRAVESIQLLTLMYSALIMPLAGRLFSRLGLYGRGLCLAMAVVCFHPAFIWMAGGVNNDILCVMLGIAALSTTVKWAQSPSVRTILPVALCVGLSMMAKLSGGLLAPGIAVVFLWRAGRDVLADRRALRGYVRQFALFAVICVPLALWWQVKNAVRYGTPLTYVPGMSSQSSQYVGGYSVWQRLFGLPIESLRSPFLLWAREGGAFNEYSIPLATLKTAVFDETALFSADTTVGAVGLWVSRLLFFSHAFLALGGTVATGEAVLRRRFSGGRMLCALLTVTAGVMAASYLSFCFAYAHTCTMNFRYLATLPVIGAAFWGALYTRVSRRSEGCFAALQSGMLTLTVLFCGSSAAVYTLLMAV